jgi:hypothetical protein
MQNELAELDEWVDGWSRARRGDCSGAGLSWTSRRRRGVEFIPITPFPVQDAAQVGSGKESLAKEGWGGC